jgi:NAD(P)H-dependent FMN reductase
METKLRIGVILASIREGRKGEAFAHWVLGLLSNRTALEPVLIDLKDWPLPHYTAPELVPAAEKKYAEDSIQRRWAERISSLDAFVIVTPEYNRGYSGVLKNALDTIYAPWNYKPAMFVGYGGFAAGARAVELLHHVAIELRMVPIRDDVNLKTIGMSVDGRGWPTDELYRKKAEGGIDELVWLTSVLQKGRELHPHP